MPSAILSILSITFCGYLKKKKTLLKSVFSKLLLWMCKNRPQELHFLVVIKKVYQPPGTLFPRTPETNAPGPGRRGPSSSILKFSVHHASVVNQRPHQPPPPNRVRLFIMSASGRDALLTLRGQPVPQIPALHNFPLPRRLRARVRGRQTKPGGPVRDASSLTGTRGRRGSPRPWRRR